MTESILVRGVNWLGDAVMTTPALRQLRAAKPGARITLLTLESLAGLWRQFEAVDSILTFNRRESLLQIGRRIRQGRFDTGLIFPNSTRSALEMVLGGVRCRIGYGRGLGRLLLTRQVARPAAFVPMRKRTTAEITRLVQAQPPPPGTALPAAAHHLHHYLHLTSALGAKQDPTAPKLSTSNEEIEAFEKRFNLPLEAPGEVPTFGLNPGAAYGSAKQWPLDRFIQTAIEVRQQTRCRWLLLGGTQDVPSANRIEEALSNASQQHQPSAVNLAGKTSVRELCVALQACKLVLTNDSGPMHLAAALGTRVVVPFGSTSQALTGPGLPGHHSHSLIQGQAPCAPCFLRHCPIDHRCMTSITVNQVVAACLAKP